MNGCFQDWLKFHGSPEIEDRASSEITGGIFFFFFFWPISFKTNLLVLNLSFQTYIISPPYNSFSQHIPQNHKITSWCFLCFYKCCPFCLERPSWKIPIYLSILKAFLNFSFLVHSCSNKYSKDCMVSTLFIYGLPSARLRAS